MPSHLLSMLRLISQGKGVSKLLEKGLLFPQIAKLLSHAEDEGLIFYNDKDRLVLSEKGRELLMKRAAELDGEVSGWIDPLDSARIDRIDIHVPYLPNARVISQLKKR